MSCLLQLFLVVARGGGSPLAVLVSVSVSVLVRLGRGRPRAHSSQLPSVCFFFAIIGISVACLSPMTLVSASIYLSCGVSAGSRRVLLCRGRKAKNKRTELEPPKRPEELAVLLLKALRRMKGVSTDWGSLPAAAQLTTTMPGPIDRRDAGDGARFSTQRMWEGEWWLTVEAIFDPPDETSLSAKTENYLGT